jgi:hypothetical protein
MNENPLILTAIHFFERLISCKQPGESDAAFVRRLDVNPSNFQRWRDGKIPMVQTVARIAPKVEKHPCWLLFGDTLNSNRKE